MADEPKIFPIENYSNGNRKRAQTIEVVDGDILSLTCAWHEDGSLEMKEFHIYYGGTYFKVKETRWDKNGREVYFESFHNPFNLNYELEDTIKYSKNTFYLKNGHRREVNFKHIFTDRDIEGVGKFPASEKSFHHGKSCEWDSEGQIISERNYLDGKADGASIQWHSNSQMSWKIYMKQGKFHGKSVTWDINGQKKDEGIYINNNKDGKWSEWHEDGQKKLEANYKDNKQDGEMINWDADGDVIGYRFFKEGELVWSNNLDKNIDFNILALQGGNIAMTDEEVAETCETFPMELLHTPHMNLWLTWYYFLSNLEAEDDDSDVPFQALEKQFKKMKNVIPSEHWIEISKEYYPNLTNDWWKDEGKLLSACKFCYSKHSPDSF